MFGIGLPELIIIGVLALLIIGPKDLPGMARRLGGILGGLRNATDDFRIRLEDEVRRSEPTPPERTSPPRPDSSGVESEKKSRDLNG